MRRRTALTALFVVALTGAPGVVRAQAEKPAQRTPRKAAGAARPAAKLVPQMPPGAPGKAFRFPKTDTRTLANGLRVFVVSSQNLPAVIVRLVLTAAGTVQDPPGKPGVAAMTANLLTQGTEKRTAQQIAEAIDFAGGSLSASADSDGTYVTVSVVKKDFDLAMDLLSDVALRAAFQKEELDRRRQQLLSNLRVQYADPGYLASVVFDRVTYAQHPYGLPEEGTPESVAKLERDDLVRFRDTHYAPSRALLAFAGDITPEPAFAAAEKYFGAWPKKEIEIGQPTAPQQSTGLRIHLIDKPDAVQTQIRVGQLGIPRNHPDYIPLFVTNRIFGGGFNSRLNTEVRQKKGLTYGASSAFVSHKLAGSFEVSTSTRTEATVEAVKLVLDVIRGMTREAVTQAELDFARDYLVGVFPIQTETAQQVAGRVLNVAHFELPSDYNDTYQERVRTVGREQAKTMTARYFDSENLDLVLVGNVGQFREALKKEFAGAKYEEIPFEQVDLLSHDLRKAKEPAAPASPEALERGRAILAAAAQAAGAAAVDKIASLELTASGKAFTPQGELPIEVKVQLAFPNRIRVDVKLPFGMVVQGYDGKAGWVASPQGALDLPAAMLGEVQRGIDLEAALGLYQQALAGKVSAHFVAEEEWDGKKALRVDWASPAGPTKLFFDPQTQSLVGAKYRQATLQGVVETERRWNDFRRAAIEGAAEGVQIPYHWVTHRDGSKFSELILSEVKLNPPLDSSLFSKPAK